MLRQRRLTRPVVSVGNLSAGGTGKTPFVIWLFTALRQRGVRPALLTRGYRRQNTQSPWLLTQAGEAAEGAGDEVQVMLGHGVAPIAVDADRFRAARALEAQSSGGIDLYLLDDGFQHLALARDLDIVLLDSSRPPWEDDLLPAGRLREPASALARAGMIVLTRVQAWTKVEPLLEGVRRYAPRAETYLARTRLVGFRNAASSDARPQGPETLLAFAGVGSPEAFFADLCVAGFKVVATAPFPDHHRYSGRDLRRLERRAREVGAEALVTTEKDAANLPRQGAVGVPLRIVEMDLDVERGADLVACVQRLV